MIQVVKNTFQAIASIPQFIELFECSLSQDNFLLQLVSLKRDYIRNTKSKSIQTVQFNTRTGKANQLFPFEIEDSVGLMSISPSKAKQCRLRTIGEKRFVEIIGIDSMTIEVTKSHGSFYNDTYFGTLQWNIDESKVCYIAEPCARENDGKFDFFEDVGEGYTGKLRPGLVWIDLKTKSIHTEFELPLWGISKPLFYQDSFIFVGLINDPVRLGQKFCTNRRTGLFQLDSKGQLNRLNSKDLNVRYPIFNVLQNKLFYFSRTVFGPHDSCAQLMEFDLVTNSERVVVPCIEISNDYNTFPGIFSSGLNQNSVLDTGEGEFVFLTSSWRSRSVILSVDITTGEVVNLTNEGTESWVLLYVEDDYIFAIKSCFSTTGEVMYTKFRSGVWTSIISPYIPENTYQLIRNITYQITTIPDRSTDLEVILVQNKCVGNSELAPLIVFPHGGPHSVLSTAFNIYVAVFTALGFAVCLVNYSGSTGFGDRSIRSLIGEIGDLDIKDTHFAALWASNQPKVDPKRVFLFGGSHGGFIIAHLLARKSAFYKAGALRNPVINIGTMISDTDIPDWCYGEVGLEFDSSEPELLTENGIKS
jgi:acylaminoacyl-peptidase